MSVASHFSLKDIRDCDPSILHKDKVCMGNFIDPNGVRGGIGGECYTFPFIQLAQAFVSGSESKNKIER